jgi:nucleotide-binding universal stress UspA family protein
MFTRILAAIDGSERTDRVMEVVRYLARTTGAAVHVVHADESDAVYDQIVDLEDDSSAHAVVNREVTRLRAMDVVAGGEVADVLHDDVAELLLHKARELRSDLIVLGPRHHSRFAALVGASVSLEVALSAPVAVLLVA